MSATWARAIHLAVEPPDLAPGGRSHVCARALMSPLSRPDTRPLPTARKYLQLKLERKHLPVEARNLALLYTAANAVKC